MDQTTGTVPGLGHSALSSRQGSILLGKADDCP